MTETQVKNGLESLTEKYGYNAETRTVTNRSFDSAAELDSSKKNLRRIRYLCIDSDEYGNSKLLAFKIKTCITSVILII